MTGTTLPEADAKIVALRVPREGLPPLITTAPALAAAADALAAARGSVAVDAERASGYRYGQRAYLVQIRRQDAGTVLVDPIGCPDLSPLHDALRGVEWVLHAASQDLPCLAEIGMRPDALFDTELAGRLAGYPRVGLAALTEELLGYRLDKEHSAVDWSKRPLPDAWLNYAALDVEVLTDLRDALAADLDQQGKLGWAAEEFAALVATPPPVPRTDPWRRTSHIHRVRTRRSLAVVRALWLARDAEARDRDIAPGRVLPDAAIVEAAHALPTSQAELAALPAYGGRGARRSLARWWAAVEEAQALPHDDLPETPPPGDGPPPPNRWSERDPDAAARLREARTALAGLSETHRLPVENLATPDIVRRLAWQPPDPLDAASVGVALRDRGVREWQVGLVAAPLAEAFTATA